jgi:MFS family permease
VGFPGLLLAYFTWKLPIEAKTADTPGSSAAKFRLRDVGSLLHNVPYIFACLGYAGISFAFGALVWFAPTFFARDFGYGLDQAGFVAGAIQVGAGLLGAPFGGFAGDYWQRRSPRGRAYTLVLSMFLSGILLYVGLELSSIVCFFFSTFFMLWHVGVASALVFDVTSRHIWNTGQSLAMFLMHLLGDIPSTAIVGYVSDRTGLKTALSLLPIPMFLAALFFLLGGLYLRTKAVSANDRLIS